MLGIFRDLSSGLLSAADLESVLTTVARTAMSALSYEDCVIYLADQPSRTLVQRAAHGPKNPSGSAVLNPITIPFGRGIVGACAASGHPVLVADTRSDPRYIVDDCERRSELAVPLIDRGVVIGVIDSEHSEPGFYTEEDLEALVDIAAIAAVRLRAAMSADALQQTVDELERTRQQLATLVRTDHLTALANRRGFEDELEAKSKGGPVAIALLDLDGFKSINDTYGHIAGDAVLTRLAAVLEEQMPDDRCFAGRLGGDEFGLLGPDLRTVTDWGVRILERVRSIRWRAIAGEHRVSASLGAAPEHDANDLWGMADEALFVAKSAGGDRMVVHDPADKRFQTLRSDRVWAEKIRAAIADDSFTLVGQPIVPVGDLAAGPSFFEMLLRYREKNGNIVGPAGFLGVAETFRLSEDVDHWVVAKTVGWLAEQDPTIRAAANVTGHFVESPRALPILAAALEESGVDPRRLCLEITESIAIADVKRCAEMVRTARSWGCSVAIDDFGRGWSSLPLVRDLSIDLLKIDGQWVCNVNDDPLARSVVTSIVEAAQIVGVSVVAEWVEDQLTADFLIDLGVPYLQGHFVGRPVPLGELVVAGGDRVN